MRFGFGLPTTTDGEALCSFAQAADELGVESVWTGDHIVMPSDGADQYPYTKDGSFTTPADAPIMETMTVLSYVAARTRRVKIGSTVVILAHRNPLVQAKMFATLDVLTGGRVICGVGVGWLQKEFEVLGMPYAERGALSDEYLEIFKCLWTGGVSGASRPLLQLRRHQVLPQARPGASHPDLGRRPQPGRSPQDGEVWRRLASDEADPRVRGWAAALPAPAR